MIIYIGLNMGHKLDRVPAWLEKQRIGGTWLVLTHLCKISHRKLYRLCTGRRPPCRLVLDPPGSKLYILIWAIGFRHRSFSQSWSHLPNYLCVVETGVAAWGENSPGPNLRGVFVRPKINEILDGQLRKVKRWYWPPSWFHSPDFHLLQNMWRFPNCAFRFRLVWI